MSGERIFTAFHESFALSTPSIAQVLAAIASDCAIAKLSDLRERTSLGTNYVKAMPRYARGCGLIEMTRLGLTPLGQVVYRHDPHLRAPTTLWLMHYHLSAPHGPGPAFWSHLVTHCLPFGAEITGQRVVDELAQFLDQLESRENRHARSLHQRTLRATKTVFLGTYTKSDGLGRLGFLTRMDEATDERFQVADPQLPPPAVVAYALADYWEASYPRQAGVSVSELARPDGFARLLWMDAPRLDEALDALRRQGVVDLYRHAPPYQVMRCWSAKHDLLESLYRSA